MSANPSFTNALIHERSAYLLQHAHNPVNWMPWSAKVMDMAKAQNKPILLSIGYAACHWCHVMERESFEDELVADFMNTHFINVKVDREERPDIDHIYMDALQAMTGAGGWPLNMFLMPDGKPFYGGTYFPPKTLPQRPSWMDVLQGVREAFQHKHTQITQQANQLIEHIQKTNVKKNVEGNAALTTYPNLEDFDLMAQRILQNADQQWGGFGAAPKFPQTFSLQLLLRNYYSNKDQKSLDHVIKSLESMIKGGIYDHLGGGFARYSTDTEWKAPHFEKMLYDNALMITILSEAFQLTKNKVFEHVIEATIAFVERELKDVEGGYYSALDADSEGVEGKYYTWQYDELYHILPTHLMAPFCAYFQVEEDGNWEATNILWTTQSLALAWSDEMVAAKQILLDHRSKRIRPALDDKKILSWNALMISALCKAAAALDRNGFQEKAIAAMLWLEKEMVDKEQGIFYHTQTKGKLHATAFLEDYACLIQAYIQLNQLTGNADYLLKAKEWMEYVQVHFIDEDGLFFYFTTKGQEDIVIRKKETYDGATPSSNALICAQLWYLSCIFDNTSWKQQSLDMLDAMYRNIIQYPSSFAYWGQAFYGVGVGLTELVAIGPRVHENLPLWNLQFLPHIIPLFLDKSYPYFPSSIGKQNIDNQYFICKNQTCPPPSSTIDPILAII